MSVGGKSEQGSAPSWVLSCFHQHRNISVYTVKATLSKEFVSNVKFSVYERIVSHLFGIGINGTPVTCHCYCLLCDVYDRVKYKYVVLSVILKFLAFLHMVCQVRCCPVNRTCHLQRMLCVYQDVRSCNLPSVPLVGVL